MNKKISNHVCCSLFMIVQLFYIAPVCLGQSDKTLTAGRIDSLIGVLYVRKQFNGEILVSKDGKIIYQKAFGKVDFTGNTEFTISTPVWLASVSKQFTAAGILILAENHLLTLDDHLDKYFPEFPSSSLISIRHLLTHTSGIVNYENIGINGPGLTNSAIYAALIKHKTLQFPPGNKYDYSNSGYVLLAMIIEKVANTSYAVFMQQNIFGPLSMKHTFVVNKIADARQAIPRAYGKFGEEDDAIAAVTGDAGICSSAEDLFKWEKALYTDKPVSQALLKQAFAPMPLNNGSLSLYGFGWMLKDSSGNSLGYHTGGTGGYRTYMEHNRPGRVAIIILNNIQNSPRREMADAINNILENKPYKLPKMSIATEMYALRNTAGLDSAIQFYKTTRLQHAEDYDLSEQELNLLGYKLFSTIDEAIRIFQLNVDAYPQSTNSYESLGEAYLQIKDNEKAKECFNQSLKIDPTNQDAIRMLRKIPQP